MSSAVGRSTALAGASRAPAVLQRNSDLHITSVGDDIGVLDVVCLTLQFERFAAPIPRETAIRGLKIVRELVDDDRRRKQALRIGAVGDQRACGLMHVDDVMAGVRVPALLLLPIRHPRRRRRIAERLARTQLEKQTQCQKQLRTAPDRARACMIRPAPSPSITSHSDG